MTKVFIASDNIVSPLGNTTAANFSRLKAGISAIEKHTDTAISAEPFYAALFPKSAFNNQPDGHTKFEQLCITSVEDAVKNCNLNLSDNQTIFILSSTKGNIGLLENAEADDSVKTQITLTYSAKKIASHFGFVHQPVVVSNACISGLLALTIGMRFLQSGRYKNAVVLGADTISKFILSGFQSFQAVSNGVCKPFDAGRTGINLGEAAATIVLTTSEQYADNVIISGGAVSNDANHISGPSRTGEELAITIKKAIFQAGITAADIDFISAHGTATIYNDEMEAKAITLAGLQQVPTNSLKAYLGHTLGAAGVVEVVIAAQTMRQSLILPSKGFETMGVSAPINICTTLQPVAVKYCLKTASGFGGCNASVVLSKP